MGGSPFKYPKVQFGELLRDFKTPRKEWTVDMWLKYETELNSESMIATYPNAKKAAEIKASPLFKALK